ncbi:hypothetical protein EL22_21735 [Halostagnicola sp. A56]|uniref:hypothetical protein n=1 Tax=Halostagnicola sp. A56 TaxID=1495067 RepID=UPI0004A154D3|nr:hypothetical protein [Halostagnicola sp. A56]KDE59475.1 hypothetical protein EL22_21735 [Halostagnicola sp. A56]
MCAQFTDDDVGKSVVNENGDEVGIVADVEHGTAHVKPDAGITDTIKAKLGWQDTDEEMFPLQEEAVARVSDDEVRLEGDLGDTGDAGTGTTAGAGSTAGDDSRQTDDDGILDDDDGGLMDDDDDGLMDDDSRDDRTRTDDNRSRTDDDDDRL